jgi:hypothetical protein
LESYEVPPVELCAQNKACIDRCCRSSTRHEQSYYLLCPAVPRRTIPSPHKPRAAVQRITAAGLPSPKAHCQHEINELSQKDNISAADACWHAPADNLTHHRLRSRRTTSSAARSSVPPFRVHAHCLLPYGSRSRRWHLDGALWHRQAIHKGQEFFRQVACLRWLRVETSRTSMPTRLPTREAGLWALVVRIGHTPWFVRLVVLWWYVPLRLLKLPEVRELCSDRARRASSPAAHPPRRRGRPTQRRRSPATSSLTTTCPGRPALVLPRCTQWRCALRQTATTKGRAYRTPQ